MQLIRKISITILLAVTAIWLLSKTNFFPNINSWFTRKPLLIENTPLVIEKIKSIQELVTITSASEVAIYKYKNNNDNLITNILKPNVSYTDLYSNKLGIIVKGYLHAGIDFSKMTEKSITAVKDSVIITLPQADILTTIVNPSNTEIFIEQGSWPLHELNAAKSEAKDKLIASATEHGILQKANARAEQILEKFLKQLGYRKVTFIKSA